MHLELFRGFYWKDEMELNQQIKIEILELEHILQQVKHGSISNYSLRSRLHEVIVNLTSCIKDNDVTAL